MAGWSFRPHGPVLRWSSPSQDWAMGARQATHYVMERPPHTPPTKFQAIHTQPTRSNKKSSLSLICIKSGQSPTWWAKPHLPSGQTPTRWAKRHLPSGQSPTVRWAKPPGIFFRVSRVFFRMSRVHCRGSLCYTKQCMEVSKNNLH